ncbi:DUF6517 family protein [Salinigranum sp.]|uniref:DUF6517 family protein n=1 Tax=Salinigranum sp. TaxID=1966351 RepID=UPI003561F8E2
MRGLHLPFAALLVVVAGCTGTLVEMRSGPATVPDAALVPAGYVHGNTTEVPLTYPVGVGPVSRDVTVYVWVSGYSRTVTDASGANATAALLVVSSPNRKIENQSVNPFAQLSNRGVVAELFEVVATADNATGSLVDGVSADVTEVGRLEERGVQNRTVLGRTVEVVTYAATVRVDTAAVMDVGTATPTTGTESASAAGATRTLLVHLMAVEHGDDVVFAMGVHGDDVDEAETIAALMEAIEHEAAADVDAA